MYLNSSIVLKNKIDFSILTVINSKRCMLLKKAFLLQKWLKSLFFTSEVIPQHLGWTLTCFKTHWKNFIKLPQTSTFNLEKFSKKLVFSKYYYNGLGYKIFLRNNYLFIWVGLTHYTILQVPINIKIFAKKRRIYIVGTNKVKFNEFLMKIRQIRKMDLYKGKGLLEVRSYKGFIKMKSGKRKQY